MPFGLGSSAARTDSFFVDRQARSLEDYTLSKRKLFCLFRKNSGKEKSAAADGIGGKKRPYPKL